MAQRVLGKLERLGFCSWKTTFRGGNSAEKIDYCLTHSLLSQRSIDSQLQRMSGEIFSFKQIWYLLFLSPKVKR